MLHSISILLLYILTSTQPAELPDCLNLHKYDYSSFPKLNPILLSTATVNSYNYNHKRGAS